MEREHVSGELPVVKATKGKFTAKDIRDLLRHVGHEHVPADLDQRALRRDINYAVKCCEYYERREPTKGVRSAQRKYDNEVSRAAKKLLALLLNAGRSDLKLAIESRVLPVDFLPTLRSLADASAVIKDGSSSMLEEMGLEPERWFRRRLIEIYESHFRTDAKHGSWASGDLDGPYPRFTTWIASKLDKKKGRLSGTFAKALTLHKKAKKAAASSSAKTSAA